MFFKECKSLWSTSSRAYEPHYTQLSPLTCPRSQKYTLLLNQTSSRKSGSSSILFSNHRHITKGFSGFCMGTAEDPSLRFFAMMYMKDRVLGNVFGRTFSDSFQQNFSLYPHCHDILQLTSRQIWDFLPSYWISFLILWLEICVPNDKFGFSRDNC